MHPLQLALSLAAALGLAACYSDRAVSDPYADMPCKQKIDAIAQEVQDAQPIQVPAAKAAVRSTDTASPDTAMTDTARKLIPVFRSFPPVAGLDSYSGSNLEVIDSSHAGNGNAGSSPGIQWIPPVGFNPEAPDSDSLPDTSAPNPETTTPTVMPKSISAVRVVSGTAYKARIRVYDYREVLVREFRQEFGYQGELDNPNRMTPAGLVSYLVWDNQDAMGRTVPSGVYLWRVRFEMESGQAIEKSTKVGFIGEECRQSP
jgi:hypothetical protein